MTNKLTPFEQMVYDWFQQGYTAGGIAVKYKIKYADVVDARYQILKKGYELEKICIPNSEKEETFETGGATMEHKDNRRKHLTEEEKEAVIAFRKSHTYKETTEKFGVSAATIASLEKKAKAAEGTQQPEPMPETAQEALPEASAEPETAEQEDRVTSAVPEIVLVAARGKLKEIEKCIGLSEQLLAGMKADRDTLAAWMEASS